MLYSRGVKDKAHGLDLELGVALGVAPHGQGLCQSLKESHKKEGGPGCIEKRRQENGAKMVKST